jgi:hypothetical protein
VLVPALAAMLALPGASHGALLDRAGSSHVLSVTALPDESRE